MREIICERVQSLCHWEPERLNKQVECQSCQENLVALFVVIGALKNGISEL